MRLVKLLQIGWFWGRSALSHSILLSSVDLAVVAFWSPISEAVMTPLSPIQSDQIDKAIRELDPLSQAEVAERSDDEYNDLRDMIIALLESDVNKFNLTLAVSAKIGFMGIPENSVDVDSFIAKVLEIAESAGSE